VIVGPGAANNFHAKVINPCLPRNGSAVGRDYITTVDLPFSAGRPWNLLAWIRWCWSPPPRYFQKISALRVRRERRTLGFIARIQSLPRLPYCMHSPDRFRNRFQNRFETLETFWKLLGGKTIRIQAPCRPPPSSTPLRPTRPASAMAQIDPAPPAELVDPVSASPLEPFANSITRLVSQKNVERKCPVASDSIIA